VIALLHRGLADQKSARDPASYCFNPHIKNKHRNPDDDAKPISDLLRSPARSGWQHDDNHPNVVDNRSFRPFGATRLVVVEVGDG